MLTNTSEKIIGTKLEKRLARGDRGINQLDAACREHDIAYANHSDSEERHKADLQLKEAASKRILARDASIGERVAAVTVTSAMKAKTGMRRFGTGLLRRMKRKSNRQPKKKEITFKKLVQGVRTSVVKGKPKTVVSAVKAAIRSSRELRSGKRITKVPRVIKVPSISGGLLPIIPILSGLAAAGTIANTAANLFKIVKSMKNGTNQKLGAGLYLSKGLHGRGMYLKPYPKN